LSEANVKAAVSERLLQQSTSYFCRYSGQYYFTCKTRLEVCTQIRHVAPEDAYNESDTLLVIQQPNVRKKWLLPEDCKVGPIGAFLESVAQPVRWLNHLKGLIRFQNELQILKMQVRAVVY
jgi:hypothetical protein